MANPGDTVEIITKDKTYEGILLPRPEILDKNITVLKLSHGYNVGINSKSIKEIKVKKPHKPVQQKKSKLPFNKNLPTVSILSTGGTISSRIDYKTGGVIADYSAEDFVEMIPELSSIANIKAKKVMEVMSEDLQTKDWLNMAKAIADELNGGVDGVVVTHGTDTLHFSTAAMSFLLKNLTKPVIFTGSQRSIDRGSSDAFMNLKCAVLAASKLDCSEVTTCLHASTNDDYCLINRGTKVRKMHTSRRDAFRPIDELPIAKIHDDGEIEHLNSCRARCEGKVEALTKISDKTAIILAYPGMDPNIIDYYIEKKYKGIVISATALGHIPSNPSLQKSIKKAIVNNIPVIIASQTLYGRVHPHVYTNLRRLSIELGCTFVEDLLPETAYVKLAIAVETTNDIEEINTLMQQNITGEITERSDPRSFLY